MSPKCILWQCLLNYFEINSVHSWVELKIMQFDWFNFKIEPIKLHNFESNSADHQVYLKKVLQACRVCNAYVNVISEHSTSLCKSYSDNLVQLHQQFRKDSLRCKCIRTLTIAITGTVFVFLFVFVLDPLEGRKAPNSISTKRHRYFHSLITFKHTKISGPILKIYAPVGSY